MVCEEIRCVLTQRSVSHRLHRVVKTNRNLIYDFATIFSYVKYSTQPRNGLIHRLQKWYSRLRYHFIASRHILRGAWYLYVKTKTCRFSFTSFVLHLWVHWSFILMDLLELLILFLSVRNSIDACCILHFYAFTSITFQTLCLSFKFKAIYYLSTDIICFF